MPHTAFAVESLEEAEQALQALGITYKCACSVLRLGQLLAE